MMGNDVVFLEKEEYLDPAKQMRTTVELSNTQTGVTSPGMARADGEPQRQPLVIVSKMCPDILYVFSYC